MEVHYSSLGHHYHFYFAVPFFYMLSAPQASTDPWSHERNPGPSRAGISRKLCAWNLSIPISPPHPDQLPQLARDLLEQRKGPVVQGRHPKGHL